MILSREDILRLLGSSPPLVEGLPEPESQLQPNGLDLTVREVALLNSAGELGTTRRTLSDTSPLYFDGLGYMNLYPGCYLITFNEILHLPRDITALGFPRSSLLRSGVSIHTAVWDAGYEGRSQALMVVYNTAGFRLQRNARVLQIVFLRLTSETEGYRGLFQRENI
jgi:dUTP pyrophosphatase